MPLTALGGLLSFALKEEERKAKERLEDRLLPIWLVNYALTKLNNNTAEIMGFDEFITSTLNDSGATAKAAQKEKRTADDIMAELMPFVEADKMKGG